MGSPLNRTTSGSSFYLDSQEPVCEASTLLLPFLSTDDCLVIIIIIRVVVHEHQLLACHQPRDPLLNSVPGLSILATCQEKASSRTTCSCLRVPLTPLTDVPILLPLLQQLWLRIETMLLLLQAGPGSKLKRLLLVLGHLLRGMLMACLPGGLGAQAWIICHV